MSTAVRNYNKSSARTANHRSLPIKRVEDADWQAGLTRNHDRLRPFLNGEPLPLCFAASERLGWAKVYVTGGNLGNVERDGLGEPKTAVRYGYVELRPCGEQDYQ